MYLRSTCSIVSYSRSGRRRNGVRLQRICGLRGSREFAVQKGVQPVTWTMTASATAPSAQPRFIGTSRVAISSFTAGAMGTHLSLPGCNASQTVSWRDVGQSAERHAHRGGPAGEGDRQDVAGGRLEEVHFGGAAGRLDRVRPRAPTSGRAARPTTGRSRDTAGRQTARA